MKFEKQNQYGRSMIEMLGVLAIIGVLSVGGIAGFSKAMAKYRLNKFVNQVSMISHNITTLYASQKSYDGLDSWNGPNKDIFVKAKLIPEEMMELDNDGKLTGIVSPWGTTVYIWPADRFSDNDRRAYRIVVSEIPLDACIELATYDWTQNGSVMAVAAGFEANGPLGGRTLSGEGCKGLEGTEPLVGCPNGSIKSIPLSLPDVVAACERDTEVAIKFR